MLALTPDDRANLAVAVTTRLLHPGLRVVARAQSAADDGRDGDLRRRHIINPFREFAAARLAMRAPDTHRLVAG